MALAQEPETASIARPICPLLIAKCGGVSVVTKNPGGCDIRKCISCPSEVYCEPLQQCPVCPDGQPASSYVDNDSYVCPVKKCNPSCTCEKNLACFCGPVLTDQYGCKKCGSCVPGTPVDTA